MWAGGELTLLDSATEVQSFVSARDDVDHIVHDNIGVLWNETADAQQAPRRRSRLW